MEEATAVQKKHCCKSEVCKSAPGCSTALLTEYSVEMKLQLSCSEGTHFVEKKNKKKAQHTINLIPTVKYGGGSIMLWAALLPQGLDSLL